MAMKATIPAEKNQWGTGPVVDAYVRGTGFTLDLRNLTANAGFVAYNNKAARDAGKEPIYNYRGLHLDRAGTPAVYAQNTGELVQPAKPNLQQILAVFQAEFNTISTIMYILAPLLDPELTNAEVEEDDFDPELVASLRARLVPLFPQLAQQGG